MDADVKLGEALVRGKVISAVQLKQALELKQAVGGDLKDILVKMGFVKDDVLSGIIAQQHRMSAVDPGSMQIDLKALKEIPRDIIERHQVLPLAGRNPGSLVLAMSDPDDYQVVEEIGFHTGKLVETVLAPRATIRKILQKYFSGELEAPKPAAKQESLLTKLKRTPDGVVVKAALLLLVKAGRLSERDVLAAIDAVTGEQ